jgi:hypothetical protein
VYCKPQKGQCQKLIHTEDSKCRETIFIKFSQTLRRYKDSKKKADNDYINVIHNNMSTWHKLMMLHKGWMDGWMGVWVGGRILTVTGFTPSGSVKVKYIQSSTQKNK